MGSGGARVHLAIIFPGLKFPNVQFKPQKSRQDQHKFQVECKVPGLGFLNPALKDKKFLMPQCYTSLTAASLASNFFICVLNKLKEYRRNNPLLKDKDPKEDLPLIGLPHLKYANIHPLDYYERKKGFFAESKNVPSMVRKDWERYIINKLVDSVVAFDVAKDEVQRHADLYQKLIFDENGISYTYSDPSDWRDRLNTYLAEGTYLELKDSTKKAPIDKVGEKEEFTPSYVFAPRVTVVGGGPKASSLVYHLHLDGNEVCSPCFFNKNIYEFSRVKKILKNKSHKMTECEALSKIAKHLTRLIIQERVNYNYNCGTFDVDYYREEGVKVAPLEYRPSTNVFPSFPMDKKNEHDKDLDEDGWTTDQDDEDKFYNCLFEGEEEEHEDGINEELENDERGEGSAQSMGSLLSNQEQEERHEDDTFVELENDGISDDSDSVTSDEEEELS